MIINTNKFLKLNYLMVYQVGTKKSKLSKTWSLYQYWPFISPFPRYYFNHLFKTAFKNVFHQNIQHQLNFIHNSFLFL